jgi:hypothetical protein
MVFARDWRQTGRALSKAKGAGGLLVGWADGWGWQLWVLCCSCQGSASFLCLHRGFCCLLRQAASRVLLPLKLKL